jgi:hypothetical protein
METSFTLPVRLQLALSSLIAFCEQLAEEGQLSFSQEDKLNRLLGEIRRVLNERTAS